MNTLEIHKELKKAKCIALIWSIEDVLELAPSLSDNQAWEILQNVERRADACLGISWDSIQAGIDDFQEKK